MTDNITLNATAKINLCLDIVGVLPSGYHSLFMLMHTVSLSDSVTLRRLSCGISLTCNNPHLPTDSHNIAYRAAELFFAEIAAADGNLFHKQKDAGFVHSCGVAIHIEKRIPFEAGLGGGSADAAAVLLGLSLLYGYYDSAKLRELALKLGSDVPYCLMAQSYTLRRQETPRDNSHAFLAGHVAIALNRGEVLAPMPPLPPRHCVIIKPAAGISTAAAYAAYDALDVRRHLDISALTAAAARADWDTICVNAANVFEQCVEVPNRAYYKAILRRSGAQLAQMTGSGSAIFGIFEHEADAKKAASALKISDPKAEIFVCETL
jgi:4-diphosphocytidyl-2-C-methyl-D-erythritol kinase